VSAREEIRVPGRPELSHAADAVRAGDLVFVAGILPVDDAGSLVGGEDTVAQARFVLGELGRILAAAGCTFADVVEVSLFLTDVDDRPRINPVRQEVFGATRPASTLVEVSALAVPGARIEVDAVALVEKAK
jgi:enamine deaminase RidA (YjgF/YER057c/UK114 family)